MKPAHWFVVALVAALLGLTFASVSTYDFVQHLDRQVHTLHCSFIPGMSHGLGESGCQAAMMSPYSSIFRTRIWGGIPISLGAMSVFAYLVFLSIELLVTRRVGNRRAVRFLVEAAALPLLTSVVMLIISLTQLGTVCKLCVAIYVSSALCFLGAVMLWRATPKELVEGRAPPVSRGFLLALFGIGVAFVALPVIVYALLAPDHARFIGTCEGLKKADDPYGIMIPLDGTGDAGRRIWATEIFDPLCPACKAFEERYDRTDAKDRLNRHAVLFPLDNACNWMVTEATHPGACTVSEAVLCAGKRAPEVIAWAFANGESIRDNEKAHPGSASAAVKAAFPDFAACIGSPEAKSRLNKSLRWSVANNIRVLTPQLFVDGVKLCDEDVDLGLDYTLDRMIERHDNGTLKVAP